jgi:hypothetical protein
MFGSSVTLPVLTDPTYGLPLVVAIVGAGVVSWWALRRRFLPPPLTPYAARRAWMQRPDTATYQGGLQGLYRPAVELLGRRLAEVLFARFQLQLDDRHALRTDLRIPDLPTPGGLNGLVDDLFRAFRSAEVAESPNVGNSWGWLRRYRRSIAARDFERITGELAAALPVLEGAA